MAKRIIKTYDQEFKSQAVKLAQEIGGHKAATELGLPDSTIYTWLKTYTSHQAESTVPASDTLYTFRTLCW